MEGPLETQFQPYGRWSEWIPVRLSESHRTIDTGSRRRFCFEKLSVVATGFLHRSSATANRRVYLCLLQYLTW